MPSIVSLLVATLAVWRISHLIVAEDGPWESIARLRAAAGTSIVGAWMDCFSCVSLLMAAPVAWLLSPEWESRVLVWLAVAGGALLTQRVTHPATTTVAAAVTATTADGVSGARLAPAVAAPMADFEPPERGWAGQVIGRGPAGIVRHVDAIARAAIAASHADRPRPGVQREAAAALGPGFSDREVPRPASVTPLADRVQPADELFRPRRTPPRPSFDGTVWQ